MNPSVTLLMAVHCHQPVGNFGFVIEEAYAKSYDPFLRVLERHPSVRMALHYSGSLIDWLLEHQPGMLARLRRLVDRHQIELLAAGYYEPILPLIPEADRQGQIHRMRHALRRHGHAKEITGLWLTERIWEPQLPETLARAGIRYTMIDTNQFVCAKPWLPATRQVQDEEFWDVLGSYVVESTGFTVRVFPASKRLRYWMPFQPVERTIEFLKRLQADEPVAMTFADDGEKFGFWPKTYQWVYEEGWLEQFFSALERERSWLTTSTFQDYLAATPPDGRVALPCGSYEEMLEWSGGYFKNFFIKYPEANAMLQKMLHISQRLQEVSSSEFQVSSSSKTSKRETRNAKLLREAQQELYAGQCNCAYWHGVFGGLYLSHLRRAIYAHLIAAEWLLHQATHTRPGVTQADLDGDGVMEARVGNETMQLVVDPAEGGTVTEWSLFGPRVNLLDTLTRRPEPYHERLVNRQRQMVAASGGSAPASIHDVLGVKEPHLETHLIYDTHRRSACIDAALERLPTLEELMRSAWSGQRLWPSGAFDWRPTRRRGLGDGPLEVRMTRRIDAGRIVKTVRLHATEPVMECRYALEEVRVPVVLMEWNLSLRDPRYLTTPGERSEVRAFEIEEPPAGVALQLTIDPPATLMHFPIETVSESEGGLERTYQGLAIVCLWTVGGASSWTSRLQWSVKASA